MIKYNHIENVELGAGKGLRTVVYMTGCPLCCLYCHNPENQTIKDSFDLTVPELLERIKPLKKYQKMSGGGVTFSGGEPLMQAEDLLLFVKTLDELGIDVAIDTSGYRYPLWEVKDIYLHSDLVLLDIKGFQLETFKKMTRSSEYCYYNFFATVAFLKEYEVTTWMRYVIVPGYTDDLEEISDLAEYLAFSSNVSRIDLLPFHRLGRDIKYKKVGVEDMLKDTLPPSSGLVEAIATIFSENLKNVEVSK